MKTFLIIYLILGAMYAIFSIGYTKAAWKNLGLAVRAIGLPVVLVILMVGWLPLLIYATGKKMAEEDAK